MNWTKIRNAVILQEDERVLGYEGAGSYEVIEEVGETGTFVFKEATKGMVADSCYYVFTDRRIMVVEKRQKLFGGFLYHCISEVPFDELIALSTGGSVGFFDHTTKYISLSDSFGREHRFYTRDPKKVVPLLNNLVHQRRQKMREQLRSSELVVDFQSLYRLLIDKGIVVKHLACPNCGGGISVPNKGHITVCEHCGHNIYAQDVFQRFKKSFGIPHYTKQDENDEVDDTDSMVKKEGMGSYYFASGKLIDQGFIPWKLRKESFSDLMNLLYTEHLILGGVNLRMKPVVAEVKRKKALLDLVFQEDAKASYTEPVRKLSRVFEPIEFPAYENGLVPSMLALSAFSTKREPNWICLIVRILKFKSESEAENFVNSIRDFIWSVGSGKKFFQNSIRRESCAKGSEELLKLKLLSQVAEDRNIAGVPVFLIKIKNPPGWRSNDKFEYFMYWTHVDKVISVNVTEPDRESFDLAQSICNVYSKHMRDRQKERL